MKLWILRPVESLKTVDNPWNPWYNKAFGFIISAETEQKAREIAHENAGDENAEDEFLSEQISNTAEPWKDNKYSTCTELVPSKTSEVIMRDFASA